MRPSWRNESASKLRQSRGLVAQSRARIAQGRVDEAWVKMAQMHARMAQVEAGSGRVRTVTSEVPDLMGTLENPRNLHAPPWRSPQRDAYAPAWCASGWDTMNDVKVITAFNLRRLRAESGLSQSQLADRLEVDRRHVSRWERAEKQPSWTHVCGMAEIFGCNPSEFYVVSEHAQAA